MYIVPVIKVKQGQVILAIKKKSPKQLCESHYDILRRFVVCYYKITTHVAPSHKHTEFLFSRGRKYGTAFMGNAIRNDGTKVDAFQTINILLSEKYDFLCKNSGNMIWHELSEAYEGGLISLSQNTNAKVAYLNEKNNIYETAHNKAGVFSPGNIDSDPFMTYFYFNRDYKIRQLYRQY